MEEASALVSLRGRHLFLGQPSRPLYLARFYFSVVVCRPLDLFVCMDLFVVLGSVCCPSDLRRHHLLLGQPSRNLYIPRFHQQQFKSSFTFLSLMHESKGLCPHSNFVQATI